MQKPNGKSPSQAEPPETLFNTLGVEYEDAYADNPVLHTFIKTVSSKLSPASNVLDIGCGTGKPVAHILAQAGHKVHGIDVSAEMVRLAGTAVPNGVFTQTDMRAYQPPVQMDAVFAILSLFQSTPGDLVTMMYKFADWVRVDGYVALCVMPSTALVPEKGVYDPTWDSVSLLGNKFMGGVTDEFFFSEERWASILRGAGFVLDGEPVSYLFSPKRENSALEAHYCLLARRVEETPLLGPFPWPVGDVVKTASGGSGDILRSQRLVSEDLEKLIKGITQSQLFAVGKNGQGNPTILQSCPS